MHQHHPHSNIFGKQSLKFHIAAFCSMLFGCTFALGLLLILNANAVLKQPPKNDTTTIFSMPPQRKPPQKRKKTIIKKNPTPRHLSPRIAPPNLTSSLSGMSFGINKFEIQFNQDPTPLIGKTQDLNQLIMTENSVDLPPRPIHRVSPSFPPRARSQGISGHVSLKILIGQQGQILQTKIVDSQPSGVFDENAISAIQQWRFQPATYKNQPVKVWVQQTLRFLLQ